MASCEYYIELISAGLDGQLSAEQERELADHLVSCPACRELGVQLAAAHAAFAGMEELEAPEGFARGVMDRIRKEEENKPKVVPLFRRPQVKMLGSLAACALLCVGLMNGVFGGRGGSSAPGSAAPASSAAAYFTKTDHAAAEAPAAMAPTATAPASAPAGGMELEGSAESAGLPREDDLQNRRVIYSMVLTWREELDAPRAVVVDDAEDLTALLQDGGELAARIGEDGIIHDHGSGSTVAVVFTENSGSVTHELMDVTGDRVIIQRNVPEAGTCDMAAYLWIFWTSEEIPAGTELLVEFQNP